MRRSWILAVVLVLGVLLSGITGYLIWHTVHNSYVKAEVMDGGPGASGNAGPANGAGQDSAGLTTTRARADREKDPGASADRKVFRMAGRTPDREWKALTTVVKKAV